MQGESLEPALCHRRQKAIWKVRKKLPIGIDGFEKIRTNDFYYADKTLFIKKLIQNWGEVNLFTRPRRFGKSLNMSMLKNASLTTKNEVEELLNGEKITKRIKQELTYCEIDDSIENVWSVLYVTGYLTGMYVEQADADIFHLWIPNGEIRKLFYELVEDWFRESTRSDTTRISRFCAAFPAGDTDTIQEMLSDYLWDSISVKDTAVRRNMKENFYHGMMLGLLQNQDSWLVKSNAETGEGYSDISIQTPERTGIVIELKYAEDGNMEKACSEALKQIEEKKYAEGLKRRGMKKIIKYGIAFYEKACMVVKE